MNPSDNSFGTTVQINSKFLFAALCIFIAYISWPTDAKYWGYGFISICMGLASIGLIIDAIKMMVKLYQRKKIIAEYMAQGKKPKSSKMASEDALRKAGMFDV